MIILHTLVQFPRGRPSCAWRRCGGMLYSSLPSGVIDLTLQRVCYLIAADSWVRVDKLATPDGTGYGQFASSAAAPGVLNAMVGSNSLQDATIR